jgi:amino acid permease
MPSLIVTRIVNTIVPLGLLVAYPWLIEASNPEAMIAAMVAGWVTHSLLINFTLMCDHANHEQSENQDGN